MQNITYNQLLAIFDEIGTNHYQINRTGNGVIEDVNTFGPTSNEFPILWVSPQSVNLGENALIYKVRVLVFDIDEEDDSHRTEILSDTLQILSDVIKSLKIDDDRYFVTNQPEAIPFNQRFVDYCTGWYADVEIETALNNNPCDIPRA
jgi:hypothetical protein